MTYKYTPTPFMLDTSHYDKSKADRAVAFIQNLCHTKGKWAGKKFLLLPWQEQIVRDLFGIVKEDGKRQFLTAYVEIPKKQGKSELAAAIALYLLYADNEPSAEVYGAACDRSQASIVYDVAKQMVQMSPALMKRSKITAASKRIVNYSNAGFYQVLSAETGTKHGLNVSGLVFDEIHAQPNRKLYDVLTKGSGDAREQPLFFIITTAGNDKNSICYELHTKALDIQAGRKKDVSFYPVVYGLSEQDDWNDEANWYKANPSLGETISIDRVREAYKNALENPAEENVFKQLRLNMWTSATVCWIPDHIYDRGNLSIDLESLNGRECYGGLDLSSTSDITALVLVFPPRTEDEKYIVLPFFWLPKDTLDLRCRRDHVLYDVWELQGYIQTTEGNVIHYGFIEKFIEELGEKYHIKEIAFDRWNATQMVQNLEDMGFKVVPFGQGYKDMSPPSKELYKLLMEGKINHGGQPVLKWMAQNVVMRQDPAGNIKPDKEKSVEKIDGIVATIMALDRCIRNKGDDGSVYDGRGILVL
ncbi:terminase large subunit [Bacillus sp. APMAM]|nr:terminase large subunit [Bacillus sp. APMAM]RTZ55574.1 terminase large subunit [Bacillus sp. SAJ1]